MNEQMDIFDLLYKPIKIKNKIRTIELFGGYGSQLLAMKYLGVDVEQWKLCEWAVKSIQAYKDVHCEDDNKDYSKELTTDEIKQYLYNKGISNNYNEPMTKEQVYRLSEEQARTIYNNIIATHNLVNIQQVNGGSLEIIDKDKYTYLMAYSFPCQDISGAGKGAGFDDTSTRSGMLWEVGRILKECKELDQLPQILMMENVPLIHSQDNMVNFTKWMNQLSELGYKNYWQDLIATDYGIPQTRNRTFMISVLGDYTYKFPKPIKLEKKLKDLLEKDVDEKYYLSEAMIKYIVADNEKWTGNNNESIINKDIASTLNTNEGSRRCDASNYISDDVGENYDLKTDDTLARHLCNKLIEENQVEEGDIVKHSYTQQILDGNKKCVERNDGTMITLTTRGDTVGVVVKEPSIKIRNANSKGYLEAEEGDGVDISSRMEYHRGTVQKDKAQTLNTMGGENNGVVVKPQVLGGIGEKDSNNNTQWKQQNRVYDDNVSISITTAFNPYYKNNLRIRKLTPRECGRLQGVKDEDITKILKHQSNASAYHLFGDSICIPVMMALFGQLLDIDWEEKLQELYNEWR